MMFSSGLRRRAMRIVSVSAVLTVLTASGLAAPAQSTDKAAEPAAAKPPAWTVTCSNANAQAKLRCSLQQTLFVAASGQRVMSMTLERDIQDATRIQASLLLPHGIFLADGVAVWVDDGEKKTIAISHADANGAYAVFEFDSSLAAAFGKGKVFRVATRPLGGKELIIELDLAGFSAAYSILMRDF
jgi:invasion protein IalB